MTEERFDYLTAELDLQWEAPETCQELAWGVSDEDREVMDYQIVWNILMSELMRHSPLQDSRRAHWLRQTQ